MLKEVVAGDDGEPVVTASWHRQWGVRAVALVVALVAAGCGGDGPVETGAGATTTTQAYTFPSLPDMVIPPPPSPAGGGGIVNVHTRIEPFSPGQTTWSARTGVEIRLRIDKPSPRVGEPVVFEVELSSAALPCCGLVLAADEESTYELGGGLACAPGNPRGPGSVTFRQAHTYKRPGQVSFRVTALAGTCGAETAGGVTGVILVS